MTDMVCQNCRHWSPCREEDGEITRETSHQGECQYGENMKTAGLVSRIKIVLTMDDTSANRSAVGTVCEMLSKIDAHPMLITSFDWSCQGWEKAEGEKT